MSVYEKGLVTILCCDLVFVLVALPLVLRKVPRNAAYGFRTRATLADDVVWYEANAHFGRGLLVASAVSAFLILAAYRSQALSPNGFLKASLAILVVPSLVAALATGRYVKRLTSDPTAPR